MSDPQTTKRIELLEDIMFRAYGRVKERQDMAIGEAMKGCCNMILNDIDRYVHTYNPKHYLR